MNDDIFKTVMDFAKRINNNSSFRVSFEWKAMIFLLALLPSNTDQ